MTKQKYQLGNIVYFRLISHGAPDASPIARGKVVQSRELFVYSNGVPFCNMFEYILLPDGSPEPVKWWYREFELAPNEIALRDFERSMWTPDGIKRV